MCPTGTDFATTAKKPGLRSAFEVLDVDHDGKISRDDLRTFYGHKLAAIDEEDAIGSMMTVADSNKDGYVEYEEFEKVLSHQSSDAGKRSGERNGVMEDVFRVMDRDGDGKVGHGDLKSYLGWAGFDASDDDIKAMIKLGGGDENGGVTFDGLCKILAV